MITKTTRPNGTSTRLRPEQFGELVFHREVMRRYLSESALEAITRWERGEPISPELADEIANALRQWATEKGATHYTHWFHPLTGLTAEKHENFFEVYGGKVLSGFNGSELLQQEPDASSFPSGGLRSTFEARGYTAWDPTSPPFIYGHTLCIPSVYVSYDGHALDYKTPLLRSIEALNQSMKKVVALFYKGVERVYPTLGIEQEFFLIEAEHFAKRLDLRLTGRTLIGAASPRGQQLEDHYFGSIPERVLSFYEELEIEAWRLGIPLKTRHNEVAPAQYECAPVFEELNVAIDHNQLLMDLLQRTARRHGLECLLHEKPFAGINGSGKHNNWSLSTDTGINLLSVGKTPKENLRFFSILSIILKAVYTHADVLRATIATPGNEHRLGGNEAPPAILSVFLGKAVSEAVEALTRASELPQLKDKTPLSLLLPRLPHLLRDNTDRNRTAPFAFTGNKFEFRAVGASAHCAPAMIVLNAAVAEAAEEFVRAVEARRAEFPSREKAILSVVRDFLIESSPIRFDGNNYAAEWREEAEKRGLSVSFHVPKVLKSYINPATIQLFASRRILTETELHARYEVRLERYVKAYGIELHTLLDILRTQLLPAALKYQSDLAKLLESPALKSLAMVQAPEKLSQQILLERLQSHIQGLWHGIEEAEARWKDLTALPSIEEQADAVYEHIRPIMTSLRQHADAVETLIPAEVYSLPRYADMLFAVR
ncbi:MAG: glutamine synthetase III [Bacteroidia bacterium]|nr:glutamine synthetase III [Bacteroidia bacterium]MCX7651974.1 glutamine synthetase III [Bacteroidia bacterium]MDW8417591.1 glutamine synthetase III [Bacteroidia bacterium]